MTTQTLYLSSLLWDKIKSYAKKAGRVATRPLLYLCHVLKSPETPKSDKLLIISALSCLILPVDILSVKHLPLIGWIDEFISISYAYEKVCNRITPKIKRNVENILDKWFSEFEYEIIEV